MGTTALVVFLAGLTPTQVPGIVVPLDSSRSRIDVQICAKVIGIQKCDSESSSLSGYTRVETDTRVGAPTKIALQDFDGRANQNMNWLLDWGWLIGKLTAQASNLRLYHADPGPQRFWSVNAQGQFTVPRIPHYKQGTINYTATGAICTALMAMGKPCADNMDLAQQGLATIDISGTVRIESGTITLEATIPIYMLLDGSNPDNGEVSGSAYLVGTASIPRVGDFDGDTDIDMTDFARIQRCLSGKDVPQTDSTCADTRLDWDDDVDDDDVAIFAACLSGANIPADPDCVFAKH